MEGNQYTFDPIREDIYIVSTDLRQKRACRHTMFIAVIGAMATTGFAMIALIQQSGEPNQWHTWILFGMIIPLLILLIGIATTINKARAINIRTGYLEAITYYVNKGKRIPYFGGWWNALRAARMCANLTFIDAEDVTPCGLPQINDCFAKAKLEAEWINKNIQTWRREIVKSFTVLTAIIYGLLSILTGIVIVASIIQIFDWGQLEWQVIVGIIIFTVTIIGTVFTFFRKSKSTQSIRIVLCYFMLVLGGSFIFGAALYQLFPNGTSLEWIFFFALGGGLLFVSSLVILLIDQIYKVRKGDYSIETYYHLWRLRFKRCPLMIGKYICRTGQKPGIGIYKCLKCMDGGQEIKNDGIELARCSSCGHSYFYEMHSCNREN